MYIKEACSFYTYYGRFSHFSCLVASFPCLFQAARPSQSTCCNTQSKKFYRTKFACLVFFSLFPGYPKPEESYSKQWLDWFLFWTSACACNWRRRWYLVLRGGHPTWKVRKLFQKDSSHRYLYLAIPIISVLHMKVWPTLQLDQSFMRYIEKFLFHSHGCRNILQWKRNIMCSEHIEASEMQDSNMGWKERTNSSCLFHLK